MKIFVAGSTGRVATELVNRLIKQGHDVVGGARHPENNVKSPQVTPVKLDLHASVAELSALIGKVDLIYFTAGSRGKDLLQTDAFGAVKLMQAAEKNGIDRFIMLSSLNSLEPEKWNQPGLTDYNIAKFFADNYLIHQTKLNYTILQPVNLTEEAGTGKVTFGDSAVTTNPIPDVAAVLAELPQYPNTARKVIIMRTGDQPIATALQALA